MSGKLTEYINKSFSMIWNEKGFLDRPDLTSLQFYFDDMPVDHHLSSGQQSMLRRRKYSEINFLDGEIHYLTSSYTYGETERNYEALDQNLMEERAFKKLIRSFLLQLPASDCIYKLGIHQIRSFCDPFCNVPQELPSPEGTNQENADFVGIFAVHSHNLRGAETSLSIDSQNEPFFRTALNPGDFLIFDDRKCIQRTSPISPKKRSFAYRDVFVFTAIAR
jgi:hypothetical protein